MAVRVAVDVGGTFTDICILDESDLRDPRREGPLDPADPMEGVMAGVVDAGIDLRDAVLFSHGTTVATNALITRRFPPVAMVTTKGFRDVIEIRRATKEDLWDAYADVAPPYIRRRDRFEVAERVGYDGEVLDAGRRGRRARGRRGSCAGAGSRRSRSASSTRTRTARTSSGCARSSRRSCRA